MVYSVRPEVFAINPDLCFGILIARGMHNTVSTPEDLDRLKMAHESVRSKLVPEGLRSHPTVHEYRSTMEKAGINPNKFAPSVEAMLKRVLGSHSLPSINALVDLCNALSLENFLSFGGHDLKDIHEDLSVCISTGAEKFLPMGAVEYEDLDACELIFTSGNTVQTRKWIWRQSELGKMTFDTSDVFFQLAGFESFLPMNNAMDELESLIVSRFDGHCERYLVNKGNLIIQF